PHTERRLRLVTDLQPALDRGEVTVYYQPKAAAGDGRVVGVEALVRWRHPALGMVGPHEFVPLAEQVGLLGQLTRLVLDTALRQQAAWAAMGHSLGVSVNVSARDLADKDLPRDVSRALAATSTTPDALTLEITESSVMSDVARSVAVLDDLAGLGVRLSVDDFGTGYSSLAYLGQLRVHELKIDKSFVRALDDPAGARRGAGTLLRTTVRLGHDLGLTVVAEGVEDTAAWTRLADLGCDLIQGYVLARPAPAAEVTAWLANTNDLAAGAVYPSARAG
ncbi:MAG TPA: EAL domain-containing protein, partial [Mycobacteriales bacterium]|nr:EAL domain-containing protein [Mycobacteriales bacterium]